MESARSTIICHEIGHLVGNCPGSLFPYDVERADRVRRNRYNNAIGISDEEVDADFAGVSIAATFLQTHWRPYDPLNDNIFEQFEVTIGHVMQSLLSMDALRELVFESNFSMLSGASEKIISRTIARYQYIMEVIFLHLRGHGGAHIGGKFYSWSEIDALKPLVESCRFDFPLDNAIAVICEFERKNPHLNEIQMNPPKNEVFSYVEKLRSQFSNSIEKHGFGELYGGFYMPSESLRN
ncbi:hypothetical protein GFB49_11300 [Epibacterium sp. SM1979]|uniref:Uncharacterized protein n=1 Tax=Tritonibacter litoralis TaxID=2662264 RepID=A0A843YIF2_9RHOB|nr:hypothetical protein [Tritonibacter litoralis]MQQ09042.1 hypothetical protein [Tritonibacter litoralis]